MDRVPARDAPAVLRISVHERVAALEVGRELQERVVLVLDERLRDLLLDDLGAPVVLKPRLGDCLLRCAREEQRVLRACDVKVDLQAEVTCE